MKTIANNFCEGIPILEGMDRIKAVSDEADPRVNEDIEWVENADFNDIHMRSQTPQKVDCRLRILDWRSETIEKCKQATRFTKGSQLEC